MKRYRTQGAPGEAIAIVLGGGRGTRLFPLTRDRSKPAVPLAGKYRLIDVPISNCINSGIRKVYVLTQFNSASLNHHIVQTFKFDQFTDGFVEILAAEQTQHTDKWFQGTADAVRKTLWHISETPASHILVLAGDALYRADFRSVFQQHEADNADITVMAKMVSEEQASAFGVVRIDDRRQVLSFHEKPKHKDLGPLRVEPEVLRRAGMRVDTRPILASMGIYLFRREVLFDLLGSSTSEDFGKEVIPSAIGRHRVVANLFDGYWEDIGTIKSFFQANLDLLNENPEFSFYDSELPIYTHSRILPSSEVIDSHLSRALLAEGCLIKKARIVNSVIGIRSIIDEGAQLENTVVMGADYYEGQDCNCRADGAPHIGIGPNCVIRNAIIDKNARIGANVRILNEQGIQSVRTETHCICDGVVVVPKGAVVPPGTVI